MGDHLTGISYMNMRKIPCKFFCDIISRIKASIITTEGSKLLIPVTDTLLV